MKRITLGILALALIAGSASAEKLVLTVDEAVELAMDQNLGLQQSAIELQTSERARRNAWNAFLPTMAVSAGFDASHYGVFDYTYPYSSGFGDAGNLGVNAGLNLSLPINIGLSAGIRTLKSDYEAGLLTYEDAIKQLERDVRKQFHYLIAFSKNINIQETNLELAQKRLDQAQSNFANGLVPELEVLAAEVTVANLQPVVDSVSAGYESMVLAFKFLLGLDRSVELEVDGDLETELYELDAEELIRKYMAGRMDLRILDQQIESLELTKRALGMNMNTPTLSLSYLWGTSGTNANLSSIYGAIDPWTDFGDFGKLSIGLQWKFDGLIPGSSTSVQLNEMQDGIDTLGIAKEMAVEGAGMEITNLVNNLATYAKTIEGNTSSVELARKNYELTEEAYQVGTRELLDVETQQQAYLEATQQLLLNQYEYIGALLDLEYALNAEMEEFLND